MALVRVSIPIDGDWLPTDLVRMRVGSPHAADLASSTPAGGEVAVAEPLGDPDAREGGVVALSKQLHFTGDTCPVLPVGGDAADGIGPDAVGNVSAAVETFVQVNDRPRAPTRPLVTETDPPEVGQALFSFTPSEDVDF